MLELKKLRYFVEIAETGSFSQAARRLSIAQPALSRHVRELEEQLGALFRRNGRGVELTEIGALALPRAQALLREADKILVDLHSVKGKPVGAVMIGMPPSVTMTLVPPLVRRIRRDFPGIHLRISEGFSGDVTEWLTEGRLDIAVLYKAGRSAHAIGQHLMNEDLFLVGRADAPILANQSVRLADVLKLPLVLPGKPHGIRLLVESVAVHYGLDVNVHLELDAMALIKELVLDEDVYTILPFGGVYHQVEAKVLAASRIVDPSVTRELILAETPHHVPTTAMKEVLRCTHLEVEELVRQGKWLRSR
ncbi:LysR family transcriptional regulator [Parvibaculum sp.]|uniref:LysR family transcriptional regulator n=1 Tax=Parvibaculum sp. TaxID=2024848 RepID=UPI001D471D4D|nr:LysR family transcriptional regulator [Parvibaculum sp.]MBX3490339.1 LysR family transcriptional regulator [Parvibaculum sp.]